jgi:O-antigen/teichoic acid export membrane protein
MSEARRLFRNASYLFIGGAIADVSAFGFRLLVAREFGPSEFGLFSLALMSVSVATSVALLGFPDGIVTFISRYRSNTEQKKIAGVITIAGVLVASISTLLTATIWFTAPQIANTLFDLPDLIPVLRIFALGVPAKASIALTGALCLSYERAGLQTTVRRIFPKIGTLVAAAVVIVRGGDIVSVVFWYIAILWMTAGVGIVLSYLLITSGPIGGIEFVTYDLLAFSLPLFLSGFVTFFMNWTDTLLVGYYLDSAQVGIYQSAFVLATSIGMFQSAIAMSLYPNFSSLLSDRKYDTIRTRYRSSAKWISILTIAPAIYLAVFPISSLTLLFGQEFAPGAEALVILALGQFLGVAVGPATVSLKTLGQSKYVLVTFLISLFVNLLLNVVLIPLIGILGAAVGTTSGKVVANSLHLWRIRDELDIQLPTYEIGTVVILAVFTAVILKIGLEVGSSVPHFVIHILVFSAIYIFGLLVMGVVNASRVIQFMTK